MASRKCFYSTGGEGCHTLVQSKVCSKAGPSSSRTPEAADEGPTASQSSTGARPLVSLVGLAWFRAPGKYREEPEGSSAKGKAKSWSGQRGQDEQTNFSGQTVLFSPLLPPSLSPPPPSHSPSPFCSFSFHSSLLLLLFCLSLFSVLSLLIPLFAFISCSSSCPLLPVSPLPLLFFSSSLFFYSCSFSSLFSLYLFFPLLCVPSFLFFLLLWFHQKSLLQVTWCSLILWRFTWNTVFSCLNWAQRRGHVRNAVAVLFLRFRKALESLWNKGFMQ